mgnify:FL=1
MNKGGELLLKKTEWVSPARLIGDRNLATEPVIEKAFERILDQWKPASSIALLGLCTSTRPYSSTDTWKMFTRAAATDADPIITSNGGIIPIAFENQYPFLTYNAPAEHDAECDRLYIEVMTRRLKTFLDRFKYKAVIAAYLPKKRNRIAVEAACKATGTPYSIIIKPWQWAEMSQMVPCSRDAAKKTQMYKLTHMRNPIAYPKIERWIRDEIRQFQSAGW